MVSDPLQAREGSVVAADRQHTHSIVHLIVRLMSGALLSKALGFIREIVMALIIGTAVAADSFRTAITAVLLPISFFQAETVPAILIPMQKERLKLGTAPQGLAALTVALGLVSTAIMIATVLGAPFLVDAMVSGFSSEGRDLTVQFVEIMALAMPASVALNCLAAGEIAIGRARISNTRAALQNLSILVGLGFIVFGADVIVLACAFTLSFNALTVASIWMLRREGNIDFSGIGWSGVLATAAEFFRRLRPLLSLPIAEQANIWLERLFTSRLQTGAIASLDYARTLSESFLLLISQPVGLAVMSGSSTKSQEMQANMIVRVVLAFSFPACAFLFMFAEDIVTVIFRRGAFGETGVALTSEALEGISIGLWASTLGWILLRLLNSANRSGRAAAILILAYTANILFNTLTSRLSVAGLPGLTMIGLGESVRSLVLLAAVLFSLKPRIAFWPSFCRALPPAALILIAGHLIHDLTDALVLRLMAGCLALFPCWLLAVRLLLPGTITLVLRRFGLLAARG